MSLKKPKDCSDPQDNCMPDEKPENHIQGYEPFEVDCYTDASYAKDVGGSVIGYKIGDDPIKTRFLNKVKNTEAEVFAVKLCVELCVEKYKAMNPGLKINIYTDCQKALGLNFEDDVVLHKMIGHMKNRLKDEKQLIFTKVDKLTRKKLRARRQEMQENDNANE